MKRSALLTLVLVTVFSFCSFATAKDKTRDSDHKGKDPSHQKLDHKMKKGKNFKKVGHHKCHKHCKCCHSKKCHCKNCHCKHCPCKHCHHKKQKTLLKPVDKVEIKMVDALKPIAPMVIPVNPVADVPVLEKSVVEVKAAVDAPAASK